MSWLGPHPELTAASRTGYAGDIEANLRNDQNALVQTRRSAVDKSGHECSRLTTRKTIASIVGHCPLEPLKNVASIAIMLKAYKVPLSAMRSAFSQRVVMLRPGRELPVMRSRKAIAPVFV